MNNAQRQSIVDAQARYDAAAATGDFTAKRNALADLIRTKTAAAPRVDHNGQPLPDPPEPPPAAAEPAVDSTAAALGVLTLIGRMLNPTPPTDDTDPGGSSMPAAA